MAARRGSMSRTPVPVPVSDKRGPRGVPAKPRTPLDLHVVVLERQRSIANRVCGEYVANWVSPARYPNTTFRDGIEATFTVGQQKVNGRYPLYVACEDYSTGFGNVLLKVSFDGGGSWF